MENTGKTTKQPLIWDILILSGLVCVLILVLIPLFMIAKYSFMASDDYSYMYQVGGIWKNTHSVFKTIFYEIGQSVQTWKDWQGLYFADWLYFVILAIWGESAYHISAYIGILSLILSELFFAWIVFHKIGGASVIKSFIAMLPVIILQILLPISGMEAFYWMISVILYTLPFALAIVLCALALLLFSENGGQKTRIISLIACILLSFAVAGSNYISGLPVLCALAITAILAFILKKDTRISLLIISIWYIACFALNALSPGASVRQSAAGTGDGAVHAILMSFAEAFKFTVSSMRLPFILLLLALIPLFISMTKHNHIEFKHPYILTILSFCIFASMFTPNLYALQFIGAYRVQNLYRFTLFLLLPVNLWYWIGFIRTLIDARTEQKDYKKNSPKLRKEKAVNPHLIGLAALAFTFLATAFISIAVYKVYGKTATSVSAYYSLREYEAQIYYAEWQERLTVLNDDSVKNVVFKPYSRSPYLLFFTDLSTDADDWANKAYAEYFNKDSIVVLPETTN